LVCTGCVVITPQPARCEKYCGTNRALQIPVVQPARSPRGWCMVCRTPLPVDRHGPCRPSRRATSCH
jgi:hypothetical protein